MGCALALPCASEAPATAQEGGDDARAALSGTFVLDEPVGAARQRVHAAIDRVAEDVSFFLRSFARSRLRDKNPIHRRIRTEVRGDRVVVSYDDDRYESRDGRWRTVTATGERVQLLQQVRGRRIYQRFRGDDGTKQMVLTLSEDGRHLWLDVTVTSERLPTPLRYRLRFRRA